ncbi:GGDEF domain-containing protein [Butyrivibrio sp. JL13D10]|uniref:GGDEF domain-containing protein n=1 Tax=Butyrivibrio sp. JL13D10 TaxID=3236815 RepID=UPI0038B4B993
MLEWLEFSDIIGILIVVYVCVLTLNNSYLRKDIRVGIICTGIALAILYILDMAWYACIYFLPKSSNTDFILNVITCIVYLMIPVALSSFFIVYTLRKRTFRNNLALVFIFALIIADIVNIFYPVFFYHKDSYMYYVPLGLVMHAICYAAFVILLWDMIRSRFFDYEDLFLATFVALTMLIGFFASWINYDLKTLWVSLGISYLLMYLTLSALFNKVDVITELPNRNAYEKTLSRIKDNYRSIVLIDLNDLKKFNDTMGHKVGDQYIYATARTLYDAFKGMGMLYRIGGDEFVLISKCSKPVLKGTVESVLHKGKCDEKYGDFKIDFAYGIAERLAGDKVGDVIGKADKLMYENKKILKQGTPAS